jgi:NodT family efflux transporter outer membrane factor (OMF) lipoprotein
VTSSVLLSSCAVGPDYKRPTVDTPAAFKEASTAQVQAGNGAWKPAVPQDEADRGAWWAVYSDPVLDNLERQIDISNQNLKAAAAAFEQARATVKQARAAYWPTVTLDPIVQPDVLNEGRRFSGTNNSSSGSSNNSSSGSGSGRSEYGIEANATWELDIWGRIRRTVESQAETAQASATDLASARLSVQGELGVDYFSLRYDDELERLLNETSEAFARTAEITRNRYAVGVAAKSDVASAEAQLQATKAQAIAVSIQRAQFEHAIAVLVGKPPADFSIAPVAFTAVLPETPQSVPSTLLERRPDIAAAERRVAAANAQIGVALAAYYPTLSINGSYGLIGTGLNSLFEASAGVWAVGPQLVATLFEGGLRSAQTKAAKEGYDESVANYRQTVLTAFQQVEDELVALRVLAQQADAQDAAAKAAEEAEQLTINEYKAGLVDYTTVVTAQATALSDRQQFLTILESRFTASVTLIQALGGGWSATALPSGKHLGSEAASLPAEHAGQP